MQERKIAAIMIGIVSIMLSTASLAKMHTLKEVRSFLKKNPMCYLAIGYVAPGPTFESGEPNLDDEVYCVTDLKVNIGTINEDEGCVFARYNVDYNSFKSPYSRPENPNITLHKSGFPMISGKSCANGGFEKLLKIFPGTIPGGNTVSEALTKGPIFALGVYFLYSTESSREKWWNANVTKKGPDKVEAFGKFSCSNPQDAEDFPFKCMPKKELLAEFCKAVKLTNEATEKNSDDLWRYRNLRDEIEANYNMRFKKSPKKICN